MKNAAPNIEPEPQPLPPVFSWDEYSKMPMSVKAKFAKYVMEVNAFGNIMKAKLEIQKNYINNLFSGKTPQETLDREKKPAKKGWQFWK